MLAAPLLHVGSLSSFYISQRINCFISQPVAMPEANRTYSWTKHAPALHLFLNPE